VRLRRLKGNEPVERGWPLIPSYPHLSQSSFPRSFSFVPSIPFNRLIRVERSRSVRFASSSSFGIEISIKEDPMGPFVDECSAFVEYSVCICRVRYDYRMIFCRVERDERDPKTKRAAKHPSHLPPFTFPPFDTALPFEWPTRTHATRPGRLHAPIDVAHGAGPIAGGCKKCGQPGHFYFQCRNTIAIKPIAPVEASAGGWGRRLPVKGVVPREVRVRLG